MHHKYALICIIKKIFTLFDIYAYITYNIDKISKKGYAMHEKSKDDCNTNKNEQKSIINKRIDFTNKAIKKLEMMKPLYADELGKNAKDSKIYSHIVCLAIDELFNGQFKKRIDEL